MKMYTLDTLKVINESYDAQHRVTLQDVEKVNQLVEVIEGSRSKDLPKVGDIVEFTTKNGDYYSHAHIESLLKGKLELCEKPHSPFASINSNKTSIHTSTSGGAWSKIPLDLQYVGTKKKEFIAWGHNGACGNGAVTFFAEVSVWEYTEGNPTYTTKTHDKFHLTIREDVELNEYKYLITKDATNHKAFRTEEEYQAWLKTYNGVEKDGFWPNSKFVWTLKQELKCIPLEEYLKLDGFVIDSQFSNGVIQECRRIYKENTVQTFLPYQHEKIKWHGVKEYVRASL